MPQPTSNNNWSTLPEFLHTYDAFSQNIRSHLQELKNVDKGRLFARFVQQLFALHELSANFGPLELNEKESNDEGVDLIARGKDGDSVLFVQAKLTIDRADDVNSILSKFENYSARYIPKEGNGQMLLFSNNIKAHFLVITLSPLDGILKKYKGYSFPSRTFHDELLNENRLFFVDGYSILSILRSGYTKVSDTPTKLELHLETPVISKGNVYVGIVSSAELKRLYNVFNDSLFFENVREFRGFSSSRSERKSPNQAILETIRLAPDKMLERNNGIVFKAEDIKVDETGRIL